MTSIESEYKEELRGLCDDFLYHTATALEVALKIDSILRQAGDNGENAEEWIKDKLLEIKKLKETVITAQPILVLENLDAVEIQ